MQQFYRPVVLQSHRTLCMKQISTNFTLTNLAALKLTKIILILRQIAFDALAYIRGARKCFCEVSGIVFQVLAY